MYDENGNMTTDGHRGVTITYNNLDLPSEISKGQTKISYIYSAKGEKLAQKVTTTEGSSLTYYRGVMVYNGNTLDYILHPAGVTRKASSGYVYDYFLTDHLGSTRVVLEASGNTLVPIQTTEYYPFGLAFMTNNLDKNKRLFSGKEMQNVTFGNEMLGMYDFGSRFYDPLLNRWFCQDPASQLVSPYGYCGNNPIVNIDPNGESFLAAFLIGAMTNVVFKGFFGKGDGNFWKDYLIGGIAGIVGAGASAGVGGLLAKSPSLGGGFINGAISGATGGFAGGFVGGAGNTWMYGGNFGQGVKSGMVGGGIGVVGGSLLGGIESGISAMNNYGNFWNGDGTIYETLAFPGAEPGVGEGMEYSNAYAKEFSDKYFGKKIKRVAELHADGTFPRSYRKIGDRVLNTSGGAVHGVAQYVKGKGTIVYLMKSAFADMEQLYLTMGHEYLHAGFYAQGKMDLFTIELLENGDICKLRHGDLLICLIIVIHRLLKCLIWDINIQN